MIAGKKGKHFTRKDLVDQKSPSVVYRNVKFAHEALVGETTISLGALRLPTAGLPVGFIQPGITTLTQVNLLVSRNNFKLVSSLSGYLDFDSYSITGAGEITLGYPASAGEVFMGTVEYTPTTGLQVFDPSELPVKSQYLASSTSYTVTDDDNVRTIGFETAASALTCTLPSASANVNRIITVKKVDSGAGSVSVNGYSLLAEDCSLTFQSTGTSWTLIGNSNLASGSSPGLVGIGNIVNSNISPTAAIQGSKVTAATAGASGVVSTTAQEFTGTKTFNGHTFFVGRAATLTGSVTVTDGAVTMFTPPGNGVQFFLVCAYVASGSGVTFNGQWIMMTNTSAPANQRIIQLADPNGLLAGIAADGKSFRISRTTAGTSTVTYSALRLY